MKLSAYLLPAALLLSSCSSQDNALDLAKRKRQFEHRLISGECDTAEGPFSLNYHLRTVFFSENVVSVFGELQVHDRLPHGWARYEGKTFYKINGQWRKIELHDLFDTDQQKEFLRKTCEAKLKDDPISYFSGSDVLRTRLEQTDLQTFVIDHDHLIIVFQPYVVGSGADGPFTVKIPLNSLDSELESTQLFGSLRDAITRSQDYVSSWDIDEFYAQLSMN